MTGTSIALSSNPSTKAPQFLLAETQTAILIMAGEGQLQLELPHQDKASSDVPAAIDLGPDMSVVFNVRLKEHARPKEKRGQVEAGDEETSLIEDIGCSTPQQLQSIILNKLSTESSMERIGMGEI